MVMLERELRMKKIIRSLDDETLNEKPGARLGC